jgi:signal peptide peptidase SppA
MDLGTLTAAESLGLGLIDSIGYKREYYPVKEEKNRQQPDPTETKILPIQRYIVANRIRHQNDEKLKAATGYIPPPVTAGGPVKIGLVYLTGAIMRGDNPNGSNAVVKALLDAGRDPQVDAIVFRLDTGGGDVVASETIADAVDHVQQKLGKPVFASFGNVSASGGYFATAGCEKIFASPGTITGSIGVAAARPIVTPELLDKLGVKMDEIQMSKGAKALSLFHDLEGKQLERFTKTVDGIYEGFKGRVLKGRSAYFKSDEDVEKVAGGRVWSGQDAKKVGLVDELGGINATLKASVQHVRSNTKSLVPLHGRGKESTEIDLERDAHIKLFPKSKSFFERLSDPEMMGNLQAEMNQVLVGFLRGAIKQAVEEEAQVVWKDIMGAKSTQFGLEQSQQPEQISLTCEL